MKNSLFLIVLNGPHGIGKSSLSKLLHEEFLMSYLVPITNIRNGFSHFEIDRGASIKKTILLAQKMTEHLLSSGTATIVEGVFRETDLVEFEKIAQDNKVPIYHFILEAPLETVLERADGRGYESVISGGMTREKIISFYQDFESRKPNFLTPVKIDTVKKTVDQIYREVRGNIK